MSRKVTKGFILLFLLFLCASSVKKGASLPHRQIPRLLSEWSNFYDAGAPARWYDQYMVIRSQGVSNTEQLRGFFSKLDSGEGITVLVLGSSISAVRRNSTPRCVRCLCASCSSGGRLKVANPRVLAAQRGLRSHRRGVRHHTVVESGIKRGAFAGGAEAMPNRGLCNPTAACAECHLAAPRAPGYRFSAQPIPRLAEDFVRARSSGLVLRCRCPR